MTAEQDLLADFGAFYRAHLDVVVGFCFARTGDRELAADLAAEVFAAALIGRKRFRPERGTPRQWLLGIAANKIIDAQRRGAVERRTQQQLGMRVIEWTVDDLERIEARGADPRMRQLLGELSDNQRQAVSARVLDERDYDEIAVAAGVPAATIRKRVSRGLAVIRDRLQREPLP
jgi:RNA polymerase sigma factor (sigma-70 family)